VMVPMPSTVSRTALRVTGAVRTPTTGGTWASVA
jgi:hypothetical protein